MTNKEYFTYLNLNDIINYINIVIDKIIKDDTNDITERPHFKLSVYYNDEEGYEISSVELNTKSDPNNAFGFNASASGIWFYKLNKYDRDIREYIAVYNYSELKY